MASLNQIVSSIDSTYPMALACSVRQFAKSLRDMVSKEQNLKEPV